MQINRAFYLPLMLSLTLYEFLALTAFSLTTAFAYFRSHSISPHLRKTVYFTALKYGGNKEWEFLWRKYKQCKDAAEREKMIFALGASKNKHVLHRYEFSDIEKVLKCSQYFDR